MSHQTSLEVIAPTVEEALARGLQELGVTADAVKMEVLDTGSRGFLGLGSRQVRIRLTLKPAEETVLPAVEEIPAAAAAATETPSQIEATSDAAAETPSEDDEMLALVSQHAEKLLHLMDIPYRSVDVYYDPEDRQVVHADIQGDDLNILIGRHAEVLNAFQYILSLIIGRHQERWVQIVVDVAGYRQRRERALRRMAEKMANQAVKSGRRQYLEPMPANERRIVHLALRHREDVETQSVGEEPHRKVTIVPREM